MASHYYRHTTTATSSPWPTAQLPATMHTLKCLSFQSTDPDASSVALSRLRHRSLVPAVDRKGIGAARGLRLNVSRFVEAGRLEIPFARRGAGVHYSYPACQTWCTVSSAPYHTLDTIAGPPIRRVCGNQVEDRDSSHETMRARLYR